MHLEVLPELFVPQAVDYGAEEAGQDVDDQVVGVPDLQDSAGEDEPQDDLHAGGDVGEHAHGQLGAVEQDGVPGSLGWHLLRGECSGCKQDPQVGEDQSEEHAGEVDDVEDLSFLRQDGVFEDIVAQAEHRLMEEAQGLGGQRHKEICDVWSHRDEPNQANDHVGPSDCADLRVAQRLTDGDVALDGHARQVDWGVPSGEDCHQDEDAADGHVDLVQNVAEHKESDGDGQLDGVVDHHVDEKDVPRVFIKSLEEDTTAVKQFVHQLKRELLPVIKVNMQKGNRSFPLHFPSQMCD